jgi:hypothetical protein
MFWERLHETMDTHWNFSYAYHPQTDGEPREQIRLLMLCSELVLCITKEVRIKIYRMSSFLTKRKYEESLKMVPFEMLYGRRCRTPLF